MRNIYQYWVESNYQNMTYWVARQFKKKQNQVHDYDTYKSGVYLNVMKKLKLPFRHL